MAPAIKFLVLVALVWHGAGQIARAQSDFEKFYRFPTISAGKILEQKGYTVKEYRVTTSDQYSLRLFRVTNPKIDESELKIPLLFAHGINSDSSIYVINSSGAKPKDLRTKWANSGSLAELQRQFKSEPSARTLPTLALNLGFPVWLLSARGPSKTMTGEALADPPKETSLSASQLQQSLAKWQDFLKQLKSTNQTEESISKAVDSLGPELIDEQTQQDGYWNYTADHQAQIDIPETIDFVLREEKSEKLSLVGQSMGGALILMAMCEFPELEEKLASVVLWAPAFRIGDSPLAAAASLFVPLLSKNAGPLPTPQSTMKYQKSFSRLCSIPGARPTVCDAYLDFLYGPSLKQEPLKSKYIGCLNLPEGSLTFVQLLQAVKKGGFMHMFDYGSPERNLIAYNQKTPPPYDLSNIQFRNLSIYSSRTDGQITLSDVTKLVDRIKVAVNFQVVKANFFNHAGYFWHLRVAELVMIPSMYDIMQSI